MWKGGSEDRWWVTGPQGREGAGVRHTGPSSETASWQIRESVVGLYGLGQQVGHPSAGPGQPVVFLCLDCGGTPEMTGRSLSGVPVIDSRPCRPYGTRGQAPGQRRWPGASNREHGIAPCL